MFTISRRARMCALTVLLLAPRAFGADAASAKCSSGDLSVSKEGTTTKGAIRQTITVVVNGLSNCLAKAAEHSPKFVLYLDGNPLKGLQVKTPGQGTTIWNFSWTAYPTTNPRGTTFSAIQL